MRFAVSYGRQLNFFNCHKMSLAHLGSGTVDAASDLTGLITPHNYVLVAIVTGRHNSALPRAQRIMVDGYCECASHTPGGVLLRNGANVRAGNPLLKCHLDGSSLELTGCLQRSQIVKDIIFHFNLSVAVSISVYPLCFMPGWLHSLALLKLNSYYFEIVIVIVSYKFLGATLKLSAGQ